MTISANAYRVKKNDYWKKYWPDIQAIRQLISADPSATLFTPAEVGFGVGADRITNDSTLGFYSKEERKFIVTDSFRQDRLWPWFADTHPDIYAHIQKKLKAGHLIYEGHYYKVYSSS